MTNYNERQDEILNDFRQSSIIIHAGSIRGVDEDVRAFAQSKEDTKQALTSLIKELVAEAKPPVIDTPSRIKLYADDEGQMWYDRGQNDTIARFDQNLLKALEEV